MTDDELLSKLDDYTRDATCHQLDTLRSVLDQNSTVRYLQPHLPPHNAPLDAATFRRLVPLSSYDDYADFINQMAEGPHHHHQPLLSSDPLICFFYSSGTSSPRPKLIPYFDSKLSKAASHMAHQGSAAILRRLFPPRPSVNKILWFIYADNVTTTGGGVKVMAASTYPLQSGNANWSQLSFIVSPREVLLGSNVEHQMYCHLLCGLRNFDLIDGIRAPYAISLINVFCLLESKWEQLCHDLEHGFPSLEISDAAMRKSVAEVLGGPQPDLAKRFRAAFEEKSWGGIVRKLWPNARYVRCVTTGSMEQYYPKLKHYAGEKIPLLGGDYFASECCVGINLDITQPPEKTRFVLLPTAAYFEFIPFDMNETNTAGTETVDISGVKLGKMYEVVVTTYRGFYRYHLGDIVRVVGFHNLSPRVEFVMKAPKGPNEIITEKDLMSAMEKFQLMLGNAMEIEVAEFACLVDTELSPKQLKVFVEFGEGCIFLLKEKMEEFVVVLRRCFSSLEDGLGGIYKVQRDRGEVGPLLLYVVKSGSFDRLSQIAICNGAPASQYKPPKIIRNREIVQFLEGSALVTVA